MKFRFNSSHAPDRDTLLLDVLKNQQRVIITIETKGKISGRIILDALASLIDDHAEEFETELFYE